MFFQYIYIRTKINCNCDGELFLKLNNVRLYFLLCAAGNVCGNLCVQVRPALYLFTNVQIEVLKKIRTPCCMLFPFTLQITP